MKLKFCALLITFSFFLCLFPVNFAELSFVFSYRALHRDISWARRMKYQLLPSSHVVKYQSQYLWAVKVDFWWTRVNFLSSAACVGVFICLETCMFPLSRTQISRLASLSDLFLQLFLLFNNLFLSSVAQGNDGKWAKSIVWVKRRRSAAKHRFPPWQERLLGWWIPKKWLCGGWHWLQQESHAETGTRQQVRISVSHSCIQTLCGFPVCGVGSMSAGHPWNTWAAEPSRKKVRENRERGSYWFGTAALRREPGLSTRFLPPSLW